MFFIKKFAILLTILSLFTTVLFSQEMPQVIDKTIHFPRNVKVQLGDRDHYHIFPNKKCLIYINQHLVPNLGQYRIDFFTFNGIKFAQSDILNGEFEFIFAENAERILAGQKASLVKANDSYLYDLNGSLINVLMHDERTKQIGITEDEKYFWFVANKTRLLNSGAHSSFPSLTNSPYNHVMVFDVNTGNFISEYSTDETHFRFTIDGKIYSLIMTPPRSW